MVCTRRKMLFTIFKYLFSFQRYSFKICKLAKWRRHKLNWILIKYDEQRYLSQFESEMFDSWQYDSTRGAPQYEPNIFFIMATHWVPDFPDMKGFSGHF